MTDAAVISLEAARTARLAAAASGQPVDLEAMQAVVDQLLLVLRGVAIPANSMLAAAIAASVHVAIERDGDIETVAATAVAMLDGVMAERRLLDDAEMDAALSGEVARPE